MSGRSLLTLAACTACIVLLMVCMPAKAQDNYVAMPGGIHCWVTRVGFVYGCNPSRSQQQKNAEALQQKAFQQGVQAEAARQRQIAAEQQRQVEENQRQITNQQHSREEAAWTAAQNAQGEAFNGEMRRMNGLSRKICHQKSRDGTVVYFNCQVTPSPWGAKSH